MSSLLHSTPEEIGNFERKVTDGSTLMYSDHSSGYQYVLVTGHGNGFKVQWAPTSSDGMVYVQPNGEVIDESELTYKEHPDDIVTDNGATVTFDSQRDAIATALDFLTTMGEGREAVDAVDEWKQNN